MKKIIYELNYVDEKGNNEKCIVELESKDQIYLAKCNFAGDIAIRIMRNQGKGSYQFLNGKRLAFFSHDLNNVSDGYDKYAHEEQLLEDQIIEKITHKLYRKTTPYSE